MFNLAIIDDTIKIEAAQLGLDTVTALTYNINAKYSNRILPNVGLCFSHFDYSSISEGHLTNGDGCTYYKVTFRIVVFRPFKGEVLTGKIMSSDEYGIRISMGFFDDIFVSKPWLPRPSEYDVTEAAWFWLGEPEDDSLWDEPHNSTPEQRYYFDKQKPVRFVIEGDEFNEPVPKGPKDWKDAAAQAAANQVGGAEIAKVNTANEVPFFKINVSSLNNSCFLQSNPFTFQASMAGSGLGMLEWWNQDAEAEAVAE